MELYARVRRAVVVDKMSEREAAKEFGLARETVRKMLRYAVPPGYRRQQSVRRPKLDAWVGTIDQILEDDKALEDPLGAGDWNPTSGSATLGTCHGRCGQRHAVPR